MASTITSLPSLTEAQGAEQDAADWADARPCGTRVVRLRTERDQQLDELAAIIDYLRANPGLPLPYVRSLEVAAASLAEVEEVAELTGQPIETPGHIPGVSVQLGGAYYRVFYVPDDVMAAHHALQTYSGAVRPESESA